MSPGKVVHMEQEDLTRIIGSGSTDPEVEALLAQFGVLAEGEVIPYPAIAETVRLPDWQGAQAGRFRTVLMAWRKRLEDEFGVFTKAVPGTGVKRLDPSGQVGVASAKASQAGRLFGRASRMAVCTDPERLTLAERQTRTWFEMTGATMALQLAPPAPPALPRKAKG